MQTLHFPESSEASVDFDCDGRSPVIIGTKAVRSPGETYDNAIVHKESEKKSQVSQ